MWISDFGGSDLATTFCKQAISLRPSSAQPGLSSWANNSGTSAGDMHGIGPARYVPPFRCVASWVMWCRSDVLEVRDAAVVYEATTAAAIAMILLWGSGWLSISCSFQHCSFMFISSIEMYGRWFTIHSSLHILYTTVYRGLKCICMQCKGSNTLYYKVTHLYIYFILFTLFFHISLLCVLA